MNWWSLGFITFTAFTRGIGGHIAAATDLFDAALRREPVQVVAGDFLVYANLQRDVLRGDGFIRSAAHEFDDLGGPVAEAGARTAGRSRFRGLSQGQPVKMPAAVVDEGDRVLASGHVASGDLQQPFAFVAATDEDDRGVGGARQAVSA